MAAVVYAGDRSIPCTVINVSDRGAKLGFPNEIPAPDTFALFTSADRELQDCRVVWRGEGQVGVSFL